MNPGDQPAGEEAAGDELAAPAPDAKITPPTALVFDPLGRFHILNPDGTFASRHPVDAAVVNALMLRLKKVGSASGTGLGVWKISSHVAKSAEREARDWVGLALAELIARKDVKLVSVRYRAVNGQASFLDVKYVNLRLPPYQVRTEALRLR